MAGARKCLDCGWVKSPNNVTLGIGPLWFDEDAGNEAAEKANYLKLKDKYEGVKMDYFVIITYSQTTEAHSEEVIEGVKSLVEKVYELTQQESKFAVYSVGPCMVDLS